MSHDDPLRNVESLIQWNRQDPGTNGASVGPRAVQAVGIIGAGTMGTAVAAANVRHGLRIAITDSDQTALAGAVQRIAEELAGTSGAGEETIPAGWAGLVDPTTEMTRIAACDLVLESVPEIVAAKQHVYDLLQPHLAAPAILASNTSTIPIGRLAAGLADKSRFCGLHFFHPVRRRPLVEVIRGPETSDETIATAVAYVKRIRKMPIVVSDGPGFLVNRLLLPYLTEAMELLLDGAAPDRVDQAATDFGMAIGPLRLVDEIGLNTALLAGRVLLDAFPERMNASPILVAMFKAGRLGRKAGAGFFLYPEGTARDAPGQRDPRIAEVWAHWARPPQSFSPEAITARLLLPMVLEAARLLEEGRVRDPRSIDLGAIFGLGFPASRGGLLFWADALGVAEILRMLEPLADLGPRAAPTPMLLDMGRRQRRFYLGAT